MNSCHLTHRSRQRIFEHSKKQAFARERELSYKTSDILLYKYGVLTYNCLEMTYGIEPDDTKCNGV